MLQNTESTHPERVKNTSSEFHPAYFNTWRSAYFTSATVSSVKPARRLNLDESGVIHSVNVRESVAYKGVLLAWCSDSRTLSV